MAKNIPPFGSLVEHLRGEEKQQALEQAAKTAREQEEQKIAEARLAELRKFKFERQDLAPIEFCVNLRTGVVAAREESPGKIKAWSRVRAADALRWLKRRKVEHEQLWDFSLSDLPDWLHYKSDEKPRDIRRLVRTARSTAYMLDKVRSMHGSVAEFGDKMGTAVEVILRTVVSIAVGLGILGLLVFGWKQLF